MAYENVKVKPRQTVAQPNTQSKDLGIVSEVPMGDWNAVTQYEKLNKVRYVSTGGSGVTLLAKKQNQGVEPFVSQGWQEVWMAENYDGGSVSPDGTYPQMSAGNATNAQNDGTGENIAQQFADINEKIPSTASAENQLADKAFVNSSINNLAAFYITYNAVGDKAFPTRADLLSATAFYSGGQPRIPTKNDYAIVLADESQPKGVDGSYPTTRYSYQGGTYPNGQWDFQYVVNNTSLTQAQVDAINSGITAQKIAEMEAATAAKYTKPTGGIPESDLSEDLQTKLNENGASPSNTAPLVDGTATAGTSVNYARGDHRHPTNTAGRTFTGNITAPQVTGSNGVYDSSYRVWSNNNRPTALTYNANSITNRSNQTDTVVQYYRSSDGSTWYRIWASGWKEMGGKVTGSATSQPFTVTFPNDGFITVPAITANAIVATESGNSSVVAVKVHAPSNKRALFTVNYQGGYAAESFYWRAEGY